MSQINSSVHGRRASGGTNFFRGGTAARDFASLHDPTGENECNDGVPLLEALVFTPPERSMTTEGVSFHQLLGICLP